MGTIKLLRRVALAVVAGAVLTVSGLVATDAATVSASHMPCKPFQCPLVPPFNPDYDHYFDAVR